eukprot:m.204576 g.204576  ORF g.204576 m.204576 type:complete len:326 (-) comp16886_c2_seq4:2975-3952(-)
MDNSDQFIRLKKAKQVHELLQEYGIDSLNELMTLSRREVEYQFQDEDPVTLQRLCDAINYAKSQPEWLHREWHHVWTSTFIGGAVLCAWLVGYFNLSLLWAILLAGIVIEGTRRLKDNYYQQVTMSARRQASKMRATHFGESAEWFNQVLQDCWSLGARTYFQDIIKESVNDVFDYYKPPGMQSLAISDLELGSQGLVITHIHNFPAENETDRTVDVWLTYSSQDAKLVFKVSVVAGGRRYFFFHVYGQLGLRDCSFQNLVSCKFIALPERNRLPSSILTCGWDRQRSLVFPLHLPSLKWKCMHIAAFTFISIKTFPCHLSNRSR